MKNSHVKMNQAICKSATALLVAGLSLIICLPVVASSKAQSSKIYTINFNLGYRVRPIPKDVGAHGGVQITYGPFLRTWEAGKYVGRFSCFEGYVALATGSRPGTITFTAPKGKAVRIIGFGSGYNPRHDSATSQVSFYLGGQTRAAFTVKLTNKMAKKGFFSLPKTIAAQRVKMVFASERHSDRAIDDIRYTLVPASSVPAITVQKNTRVSPDSSSQPKGSKLASESGNPKASSKHTITFEKAHLTKNGKPVPNNTGAAGGLKIAYHNLGGWKASAYKSGADEFGGYAGYAPGRRKASIVFTAPKGKQVQLLGFDSGYANHSGNSTMRFYINEKSKPILTVKLTDKIAQKGFYQLPEGISGHTIKIELQDGKSSDRAIDNLKYVLKKSVKKHMMLTYSKTAIGWVNNTKPRMGDWWLTTTKVNKKGRITGGRFGLIHFNFDGIKIPSGMKIGRAVVTLAVKNNGSSGGTTANGFIELHRLTKKVLWDGANTPTWKSVGQYYDTKVAGQLKGFNEAKHGHSTLVIPLNSNLVEGWIDGSIVNGGLELWNLSPDGKVINTYTPGKDTAAALKITFVPIPKG